MPTTDQIDFFFTYRVLDEDLFEKYLATVLPVTEKEEPYVLEYNLARAADGTILQHERYENEEAIGRHLALTAEPRTRWDPSRLGGTVTSPSPDNSRRQENETD
ncbi:hypothetical protein [Arthrobacter sp. TWP1-1]|uniref:hypothetical protein n=1 Tax=Arthrobacter sp. TWP1-1 TaxID=2804568 RepID=UPI003CEE0A76